jgi:hypothetical protein
MIGDDGEFYCLKPHELIDKDLLEDSCYGQCINKVSEKYKKLTGFPWIFNIIPSSELPYFLKVQII